MKVNIGPYVNWIGPYQIADKILFWKEKHEDKAVFKFGQWLAEDKNGDDSWLTKFCSWVHSKKKRKVKVKIDYYDIWNIDNTLSHIIHPLLIEYKKKKESYGMVAKEDVPECLHSTYNENNFSKESWDYIIDEMIWAFDPDWDDKYGYGAKDYKRGSFMDYEKRQQNGYRLFGKYYANLWS